MEIITAARQRATLSGNTLTLGSNEPGAISIGQALALTVNNDLTVNASLDGKKVKARIQYPAAETNSDWSIVECTYNHPANTLTINETKVGSNGTSDVVYSGEVVVFGVLTHEDFIKEEGWNNVGDSGQPAFQNGWVNYGGGWDVLSFRKISNIVHIKGVVKSGTVGQIIFTLPEGYRPDQNRIKSAVSATGECRVDVYSSGAFVINTGGSNVFTSIDFSIAL